MGKPIQELAPYNSDCLKILFDIQERAPLDFSAFTRYIYNQIIILTKLVHLVK